MVRLIGVVAVAVLSLSACGSSANSVDDIKPNPSLITTKDVTPRDQAELYCELSEGLREYSDAWENCVDDRLAGH